MNKQLRSLLLGAVLIGSAATVNAQTAKATLWLTKADRSVLFEQQKDALVFKAKTSADTGKTITVNDKQRYQSIDGFGFALTGGSATPIMQMSPASRGALLKNLFATDGNNIGVNYIRLSIGASDLNDHVFSYDDLPAGQTDVELKHFDLGPDKENIIPVMKQIVAINPSIKILGSPWSPPAWMKTNGDTRGGRLKPEYYPVYAKYFVKYIQAMKANGITIDAVTIQNEPLHAGNNPSLLLTAPDEGDFIRNNLGPAFKAAGIKTKIILYDHNADRPDYPISILNDAATRKYVDGSGFHLYGGQITALTTVHDAHPDKNIYFTEQMTTERENSPKVPVARAVKSLIVGAPRNWSKNVLEWNLAAGPDYKPFTDRGGCSSCQGAITIDKDAVKRNVGYYSVAHASKFVRTGSVRIESNDFDNLSNVAFKTPAGKTVLIVANTSNDVQNFNIAYQGKVIQTVLDGGSVGTYIW